MTPTPPNIAQPPTVAIITALDAIEAGDIDEAITVLLSALEDGPTERRFPCPHCPGLAFEWPGLLDHHLAVAHPEALAA